MPEVKKSLRLDDILYDEISTIAKQQGKSINQTIESALKLYRDHQYMQTKSSFINEQVLAVFQGMINLLENNINQKTNRVLSALAIQNAIQNMILASSLDIPQPKLDLYRQQAVEYLKQNNRVLRLDSVYDEQS